MAAFRRLIFVAVCAGGLAGLGVAGLHQLTTVPLILAAESFESNEPGHAHLEPHAWKPQTGFQRITATAVTDILAGIAFALILVAIWGWQDVKIDPWRGALWGIGGFLAVNVAPSLGLPPELPGSQTAALPARQLWWIVTVILTAASLSGLLLAKSIGVRLLALGGLLLPHLVGAPQPAVTDTLLPGELLTRFHVAVLGTSAAFWLVLGGLSGWLMAKNNRGA